MKSIFAIAFVTIILFGGCKKKEIKPDASKVKFTVNSPTEGQTFHKSDVMVVQGTIEYEHGIRDSEVKIEDTATGSETVCGGKGDLTNKTEFNCSSTIGGMKGPGLKVSITTYLSDNTPAVKVFYINLVP